MPTLKIDLQDGFSGDHVVMQIDGRVVYDRSEVKTRMQVGLADSAQVEVDSPGELTVRLPDRGIEASTSIDVDQTPNIGVAVEDAEVRFRYPRDVEVMFGYV
jgi:hypothetical protein